MSAFEHILVERGGGDPLDHHRPAAGAERAQSAGASRAFGGARPFRRRSRAARRGDHRRRRARLLRRQRSEGARRSAMPTTIRRPDSAASRTASISLKPVIAAVNGLALGGGVEIVAACDLAIAADHAEFALPEPRVGLAALGGGGLQRLARNLPLKYAMELVLTGRRFGAEEAKRIGPDQRRGAARRAESARAPDGRHDHRRRAARGRGLEAGDAAEPRDARSRKPRCVRATRRPNACSRARTPGRASAPSWRSANRAGRANRETTSEPSSTSRSGTARHSPRRSANTTSTASPASPATSRRTTSTSPTWRSRATAGCRRTAP